MSNTTSKNLASTRIATLLDEGALLKSVAQLQQEQPTLTCRRKRLRLMVSSQVME